MEEIASDDDEPGSSNKRGLSDSHLALMETSPSFPSHKRKSAETLPLPSVPNCFDTSYEKAPVIGSTKLYLYIVFQCTVYKYSHPICVYRQRFKCRRTIWRSPRTPNVKSLIYAQIKSALLRAAAILILLFVSDLFHPCPVMYKMPGDRSREYLLPYEKCTAEHCQFKCISPNTLSDLMRGVYSAEVEDFKIIDTRYT